MCARSPALLLPLPHLLWRGVWPSVAANFRRMQPTCVPRCCCLCLAGGGSCEEANVGHSSLSSTSCHIRRIPGNLKLPEPPVGICLMLLASCLLPLAHLWLASPSLSLSRSRFLPPSSCYFILISSLLYGANIKSSELLSRFIDIIWMGRHLV